MQSANTSTERRRNGANAYALPHNKKFQTRGGHPSDNDLQPISLDQSRRLGRTLTAAKENKGRRGALGETNSIKHIFEKPQEGDLLTNANGRRNKRLERATEGSRSRDRNKWKMTKMKLIAQRTTKPTTQEEKVKAPAKNIPNTTT